MTNDQNIHQMMMQFAAQSISEIMQRTSGAKCAYLVMDEAYMSSLAMPQYSADNRGHRLMVGDQYMVITCANGYPYYVNVSADSVMAACAEVFSFAQYKL